MYYELYIHQSLLIMADKIQDFGGELFHPLQYESVSRRSVVDVLYKSVRRWRRFIGGGGSLG